MKLEDIELSPSEIETKTLKLVRVESKGIGPSKQIMNKCRILITNKRLVIAQKILFSKKHMVRFEFWLEPGHEDKINFFKGSVTTTLDPAKVNEIEVKGKVVSEIKGAADVFDYLRIYLPRAEIGI